MKTKLSGVYYDSILNQVVLVTEIAGMFFVDNEMGRFIFRKKEDFLSILERTDKIGDL